MRISLFLSLCVLTPNLVYIIQRVCLNVYNFLILSLKFFDFLTFVDSTAGTLNSRFCLTKPILLVFPPSLRQVNSFQNNTTHIVYINTKYVSLCKLRVNLSKIHPADNPVFISLPDRSHPVLQVFRSNPVLHGKISLHKSRQMVAAL